MNLNKRSKTFINDSKLDKSVKDVLTVPTSPKPFIGVLNEHNCPKLVKHVLNEQTNSKAVKVKQKYACNKCPQAFTSYVSFESHVYVAHNEHVRYDCSFCPQNFYTKSKLISHFSRFHDIRRKSLHTCVQCKETFGTKRNLSKHIREAHPHTFDCKLCQNKFKTQIDLSKHIRNVHNTKSILCKHCNKTFQSENYYKLHVDKLVERNITGTYICEHCDKVCISKQMIKMHLINVHNKNILCEQCPKKFNTIKSLESHILNTHGSHVCEYCGKVFNSLTGLKIHSKKSHGKSCLQCRKKFKSKYSLSQHVKRVHYNLTCKYCHETHDKLSFPRSDLSVVYNFEYICERCLEKLPNNNICSVTDFNKTGSTDECPNNVTIKSEPTNTLSVEEIKSEPVHASNDLCMVEDMLIDCKQKVKSEQDEDIDIGPVVFQRDSEPIGVGVETLLQEYVLKQQL